MAEGNSGGIMDGGPGMVRPEQPKEHFSRTPSAVERVGDRFRAGWENFRNKATELNRNFREKHGLPNDFDEEGQPIEPASPPVEKWGHPAGTIKKAPDNVVPFPTKK